MIVLLDRKIGEKIPVAYISVEPWKLLKAQAKWLDKYYNLESDSIARKLVDIGPQLSGRTSLDQIKKEECIPISQTL